MTAVPLGIMLGALNVIVIAIGMAGVAGQARFAEWVIMFAIMPGVVVGALLGWLADVMKPMPTWARRSVLLVPAVLLVVVLAGEFRLEQFILLSCIPTAVAALLLERGTRLAAEPPVPTARVVAQQPAPPTLRQLS